ncbi:uncharacterized histidine-rich protein DDB_G0274557-like, partial [Rhagoletis pomonella]|uniref:uncharacterized histidine-rich protein DDB_G0274557-like n=1 Tax=Rhagoletis pomonella TaxID=28610 RepID=UPI0017830CF2
MPPLEATQTMPQPTEFAPLSEKVGETEKLLQQQEDVVIPVDTVVVEQSMDERLHNSNSYNHKQRQEQEHHQLNQQRERVEQQSQSQHQHSHTHHHHNKHHHQQQQHH